ELVHGRQDRPLFLLHDVQVRGERRRRWRGRRRHSCDRLGGFLFWRGRATGHHRGCATHGGSHQETPAIHAVWNLVYEQRVRVGQRILVRDFTRYCRRFHFFL